MSWWCIANYNLCRVWSKVLFDSELNLILLIQAIAKLSKPVPHTILFRYQIYSPPSSTWELSDWLGFNRPQRTIISTPRNTNPTELILSQTTTLPFFVNKYSDLLNNWGSCTDDDFIWVTWVHDEVDGSYIDQPFCLRNWGILLCVRYTFGILSQFCWGEK